MVAAISSITSSGSIAAAAGAGSTIVTLSHSSQVTQKGQYLITATVGIGAAPGAGDVNNVQINIGSTNSVVPTVSVAGSEATLAVRATLDGSTDVLLKSIGNNVAPYSGALVAEYLGPQGGNAKYM